MPKSSKESTIRLNVNAAIIKDEKILLIEFKDENGIHYNLPGGGLDVGESVNEGLQRECFEEACVQVKVDRLLMTWEYVPAKENHRYGSRQKVGLVFLCALPGKQEAQLPKNPDKNQIGVRWVPLNELVEMAKKTPIYPMIAEPLLAAIKENKTHPTVWNDPTK